jgi:ATP-dependent Clp protease adapter protein ClpS
MNEESNELYDVIFFWDNTKSDVEYKQYCSETLCNILGFNAPLSVKIIYEAAEKGKALIQSTRNLDKAATTRNTLIALGMSCHILPCGLTKKN